jgi:hypothetical protein
MSEAEKKREAQRLTAGLNRQVSMFERQSKTAASNTRTSYQVSLLLGKQLKPFSDGDFIKTCLMTVVGNLCPEKTQAFKDVSLSRPTVTRRVEEMAANVRSSLDKSFKSLSFFSLALDESTDVKDTSQLAVFIRGVDDNLNVTEEFVEVMHFLL